ncbi:chromosome partitioning ATPase protein-like protein [Caballeronia temeraria]|uniref:Chromosome partitioning ATPase protein-like protein n=1 Tax=Caballeronia temeraria TaxID=1777137 RepID=A0A158ARJ3_9BURK|nr:cellulose biosynthesis protein BcsQ [Caballeronia temeraria]SAK60076.1 chromosome partitioning ATPase protein-like protein [Caballeronia temeraria]
MKTIALISTAGGAGRTTLAASLATLLARRGRDVVALDFDPQNMLGAYLGLDTLAAEGIGETLVDPSRAWHESTWRNDDGVLFVPHGNLTLAQIAESDARLAAHPRWLEHAIRDIGLPETGVVLIDTPRYPSAHADHAARAADLVLAVCPPEPAACATLVARLPALRESCADVRLVVNRLNPARAMQRDALAMLRAATAMPVAQRIHLEASMPEAFSHGAWLFDEAPHSQASHDLHGLAQHVDAWLPALTTSEAA